MKKPKDSNSKVEALDSELFQPLSDEEIRLVVAGTGHVYRTFTSDGTDEGSDFVLD
ncbi:MAG TPA: hypothetical protein VGP73_05745 [Thermoanaerobaculia bacterium]